MKHIVEFEIISEDICIFREISKTLIELENKLQTEIKNLTYKQEEE